MATLQKVEVSLATLKEQESSSLQIRERGKGRYFIQESDGNQKKSFFLFRGRFPSAGGHFEAKNLGDKWASSCSHKPQFLHFFAGENEGRKKSTNFFTVLPCFLVLLSFLPKGDKKVDHKSLEQKSQKSLITSIIWYH